MKSLDSLAAKIGLRLCGLGWHQRPFERESPPPGVTEEVYRYSPRHRCRRCGLVGRVDVHGNLDPETIQSEDRVRLGY